MARSAVIVPSFNRPAALKRCLEALIRQDDPDFEIIVVDDGSAVPLADVCAEVDPSIRCLRQDNAGPAKARNAGVRATDADFVAFTDDDCLPDPNWLRLLREAQGARPGCLVGGKVVNGLPGNRYSEASQAICDYLYRYYRAEEGDMPFFTSNNIGCERSHFDALGGFDETFPMAAAEDRDIGLRWREAGGALVYAPQAQVHHHHELDLGRFWRQHANYGRGARHLHRLMTRRGKRRPKWEPPSFYVGLVLHPLRREGFDALPIAALSALSQAAMIWGYAWR